MDASEEATDHGVALQSSANEGTVTIVTNSGPPLWEGTARLIEESSIGVPSGGDEYMFGYIYSLYANSERVLILDDAVEIARMFTRTGRHVFDLGGKGQGPGEYSIPMIVTMDSEGRSYVFDRSGNRVNLYTSTGEYETSWRIPDFACCAWNYMHPQDAGAVWFPVRERRSESGETRYGARLYNKDGSAGPVTWVQRPDFDAPTYVANGREWETPFSPQFVWAPTPTGEIVAGAGNRYRFQVLHADGSTTIVTRSWDPIRIEAEESEWHRQSVVSAWRSSEPGWNWNGEGMPTHRPAFKSFAGSTSGQIWVGREIGSVRRADCTESPLGNDANGEPIRPCYLPIQVLDVFEADGKYLGEVRAPSGMRPTGMYVDEDSVTAVVEDDDGTIMVKRFRLVFQVDQ